MIVFGSINLDLIFAVSALPRPGETALGPSYRTAPGGKGANQAVAAARDGTRVRMFGRVGRDAFAEVALGELRAAGVDLDGVQSCDLPTGCAAIAVDPEGRNLIYVATGANAAVTAAAVPDSALVAGETVLLQMELVAGETETMIARARAAGCRAMLNLAPVGPLSPAALAAVDVLIVNEIEAETLARRLDVAATAGAAMARSLAARLDCCVVTTLGGDGATAADRGRVWAVNSLPVRPVDTTGAGDRFAGVLAAALDRGQDLPGALHRAAIAGSLACLAFGAQPVQPDRATIDAHLASLAPPRILGD